MGTDQYPANTNNRNRTLSYSENISKNPITTISEDLDREPSQISDSDLEDEELRIEQLDPKIEINEPFQALF